jgi:hypothetical protein
MSRALVGFVILNLLTPDARAADGDSPVRDGANLFSPAAIARAAEQMRAIRRQFHLDFVLETTDTLPKDVVERFDRSRNPDRTFGEVALERARAAGVEGIYAYVSTMPRRQSIAVVVWPTRYRDVFGNDSREKVRRLLAGNLKQRPDQALEQAVALVREELTPTSSWFSGWTVLALIGGGLLLWVILGLVRMHLAQPPAAPAPGAERAGFVPGLLGGMFGSVAGHWIYDTLFQAPRTAPANAAPPAGPPPAPPAGAPQP